MQDTRKILEQMGEQIKLARLRRKISAEPHCVLWKKVHPLFLLEAMRQFFMH